jgi:hypothetical protein
MFDVRVNGGFEFLDRGEGATTDALGGEIAKETLDDVEL